MRHIALTYTLRDGQRGTLHCLARSTAAALLLALDAYGSNLRSCSARCPASRPGARA